MYKCIQRVFPAEFERLKKAIQDYPNAFNGGVAVVTFNGVYSDNPIVQDYDNYIEFFKKLKDLGVSAHVNLSSTVGHADVHVDPVKDQVSYQTMVGSNGVKAKAMACPRANDFISYLTELVGKYAKLNPDVFWIDDDFRVAFHMPIKYGCFCDNCLKKFSKIIGKEVGREELVELIAKDGTVNGKKIRKEWQNFNRKAMVDLAGVISDTVHAVNEKIIIGYMQVNPDITVYECPYYRDIIKVSKNSENVVYFRHGSGFYSDADPYDIVHKNFAIARLVELAKADGVNVINYSEEVTLPYARRGKSMKMTLLECLLNVGVARTDGIMDEGIKPNLKEQVKDFAIIGEMHRRSEYLQYVKGLTKGKKQLGVYPFFSPDVWQYADKVEDINDMCDINVTEWERLFQLGVPFTFDESSASVILLSGKSVRAMEKPALDKWLKKGIYADGQAAIELNRITGENVTGIKQMEIAVSGMGNSEIFTDHALNGEEKGFRRYNIWHAKKEGQAVVLADGAEVLSCAGQKEESDAGVIGTAVYKNAYGGRIATFARGPWDNDIVSESKTNQIKNVLDYLADKMPVRIESPMRVGQSVFEDEKERIIFIYNLDFDDAKEVKITTDLSGKTEVLSEDLTWQEIDGGNEFSVKDIPSFSAKIIRITK